jgi:hypothetical protein
MNGNWSSIKGTTDVYPQLMVDVSKLSLNHNQLDYLFCNGKFTFTPFQPLKSLSNIYSDYFIPFLGSNDIRPNQSYLHTYEH